MIHASALAVPKHCLHHFLAAIASIFKIEHKSRAAPTGKKAAAAKPAAAKPAAGKKAGAAAKASTAGTKRKAAGAAGGGSKRVK